MKITELILALQNARESLGDVEVFSLGYDYEDGENISDPINYLALVQYGKGDLLCVTSEFAIPKTTKVVYSKRA